MKTTRVLTLLAAFALTLSVCAYDFKSGDLYYNITRNTDPYIVEVTYQYPPGESNNYSGLKVADIPSTVSYGGKTYSVMSIGSTAFTECTSLTSVSIPESVLSIEFFAFYGCANLETAYFMGNAPLMSDGVFEGCASSFSVRYLANKSGFTDSWEGYTAVTFSEPAEIVDSSLVEPAKATIEPSLFVWIAFSVLIVSITVMMIIIGIKKINPSKFIIIRVILLIIIGLILFFVLFFSFKIYLEHKGEEDMEVQTYQNNTDLNTTKDELREENVEGQTTNSETISTEDESREEYEYSTDEQERETLQNYAWIYEKVGWVGTINGQVIGFKFYEYGEVWASDASGDYTLHYSINKDRNEINIILHTGGLLVLDIDLVRHCLYINGIRLN